MLYRIARVSKEDLTRLSFGNWFQDRNLVAEGRELCAKMNKEYLYIIEFTY